MKHSVHRSVIAAAIVLTSLAWANSTDADVTRDQVERAIRRGVESLKSRQRPDGSWQGESGMTALVILALTTAGEPLDSQVLERAYEAMLRSDDGGAHETYTIALKTMALSANPAKYARLIGQYAGRLHESQNRAPNRQVSGSWGYSRAQSVGDNSNSQYALLGLNAASEAGVRIDPIVWQRARRYWEDAQCRDGGWGYKSGQTMGATGSMTCAGISSLIISGLKLSESRERLVGNKVEHCGESGSDPGLQHGLDWLAVHFDVRNNINSGTMWKYYYLYGLERAGRLSGLRYFGKHDWYREGAEELVRIQDAIGGYWRGVGQEGDPVLATSFALLFLAKGRSPVLINKLKHGPLRDWNNDPDDVSNLVNLVARDWKNLVTWQVVDPARVSVEDLLQAPIAFISGHDPPIFTDEAKASLREYVANGGMILAEACCGRQGFDRGFRDLMKEIFPEQENALHALDPAHPVWRSKYTLDADVHPLWGIEHGCRTVVIYSPGDLSCYWQQMEAHPSHLKVELAAKIGQNIVDYATGRELPADKLAAREFGKIGVDIPKRGALHIGKLKHGGDWNIAPLAIPNLTTMLRDKLKFDVVISHKELSPDDPNLVNFPLIYIHGRGAVSFTDDQKALLRRHLSPGAGTLFADAACGSDAFDTSFRKFVSELYPDRPFEPIPPIDEFYTRRIGFDLSESQLNKPAGGLKGFPQLEGIRIDGHWAIIYSRFDLGCALERHAGIDCKGYTHESALKITTNIVIYATMP
jgi:hypothetical protein